MPEKLPIVEVDSTLQPYINDLQLREEQYTKTLDRLGIKNNKIINFANGHLYFGFHKTENGWIYREWAPYATQIMLLGDFNNWSRTSHPLTSCGNGIWEIVLTGEKTLYHLCKVKIEITAKNGKVFDRIPLYSKRVLQDPETLNCNTEIWQPAQPYVWQIENFKRNLQEPPLIYEAHIGISSEKEEISTFRYFTDCVLPRIKKLGYNTLQLMAIAEHSYYASFGYQVTNFFAVSSRFGTPDEFKELVDTAHALGIAVLLDLVHSHASPNTLEGIAAFDGTEYQFFSHGEKGTHPVWGTKLFNYGKSEVAHFLLSNIKFWQQEYKIDGFRFDGVTSMLYNNHAISETFTNYSQYFSMNTNLDALCYLRMATTLAKQVNPHSLLVCEDMSGMPGMCLPAEQNGIGFDYRLGMGLPDYWIHNLQDKRVEEWNMAAMWHELTQRRPQEKVVAYCESHDQALVGSKTIMFWLADKAMYKHMAIENNNKTIERAMNLHKMIRLITSTCGGEGYLNFMGNEFGHPEWIDFPREGNGWSYQYATRKWSLADNPFLQYQFLQEFDCAMLALLKQMAGSKEACSLIQLEEVNKLVIYEKDGFLFGFNFHPSRTYSLKLKLKQQKQYKLHLHTNWVNFGGELSKQEIEIETESAAGQKNMLALQIPPRCGLVFEKLVK